MWFLGNTILYIVHSHVQFCSVVACMNRHHDLEMNTMLKRYF